MEGKSDVSCCRREKTNTEKSPRRRRGVTHLSLVVLEVEEVCVAGQVYHCLYVVFGLVDDGQVEQPASTEPHVSSNLQVQHFLQQTHSNTHTGLVS